MEMGKIIGKSIRSEHFGILQFWEFFCQPFGENTFSKNGPKTKIEKLKKLKSFLSNQITARHGTALSEGVVPLSLSVSSCCSRVVRSVVVLFRSSCFRCRFLSLCVCSVCGFVSRWFVVSRCWFP